MRDGPIDFDGIAKARRGVAAPTFDRGRLRPPVEGGIQFHGGEYARIVLKPPVRRQILRIKRFFPMPVIPPRTADMGD